jgi:hypothetical protein
MTDEQTDKQSWDRKRQKMENLRMANLLSKKSKNQQMSRQTASRFANAGTPYCKILRRNNRKKITTAISFHNCKKIVQL